MRTFPNQEDFSEWRDWASAMLQALISAFQSLESTANIGQVAEFCGALPTGWLEADGSDFDAASFPLLARILGGTTLPTFTPQYSGCTVGIRAA